MQTDPSCLTGSIAPLPVYMPAMFFLSGTGITLTDAQLIVDRTFLLVLTKNIGTI
jgi:hypothetical protein